MSSALEAFVIERTIPRGKSIDVHVRYAGGASIFTFPITHPNSTILADIRRKLRKVDIDGALEQRMRELVGEHKL